MSWGFVLCIFVLKYLRVGPLSDRVEQDKGLTMISLSLSLHPSILSIPLLLLCPIFPSVILILFPSWPDPCISSFTPPHPIYPSSSLHSPPLPSPPFLLLSLFSLIHPRLSPSCLMRKGGRAELIGLEHKVQSRAEQNGAWCLAARRWRIKTAVPYRRGHWRWIFRVVFVHRISASVLRAARGSHAETAVVGQSWSLPRRNFLTSVECLTWRERMRCTAQSFELF